MLVAVTRPTARRFALVLLLVAEAAALATLVGAVVLASDYRPSGPAEAWHRAEPIRSSDGWERMQQWAAAAAVLAGLAAVVLLLALVVRGTIRRGWVPLSAAVIAAGAAVTALATRSLVQYDQLALWAVTVGDDIAGYWFAAFDDGVRFVIVDGTEVDQGSYARALVVHLAMPAVAALVAGLGVVSLLVTGRHPPTSADGADAVT
jgi:quinol-cytochrome oxidoreductase complex cytochrome b subunit